jgi:hypothetical protein
MKWTILLAMALSFAAQTVLAADIPRIFFSKSFPGSVPPYVEIIVDEKGRIEYREAPKEEDPIVAQLSEADTKEIWALAEKLNWFSRPLESGLKVARMGDKILRIENHSQKGEVKFNFTQDEDGKLIQDWFERMNESAQHRIGLERTVRFDKLGVNKALLLFEAAFDRKRIAAPEQFLPLLDRVAKNESYMHMARERATYLAETIRNPKPKAE